jgi:hypothetical protein
MTLSRLSIDLPVRECSGMPLLSLTGSSDYLAIVSHVAVVIQLPELPGNRSTNITVSHVFLITGRPFQSILTRLLTVSLSLSPSLPLSLFLF